MKINYFKILSPFRGLKADYKIEFNNHTNTDRIEPICFVGLNGSGKSNVLEAISEAFFYLEAYNGFRSINSIKFMIAKMDVRIILYFINRSKRIYYYSACVIYKGYTGMHNTYLHV